jgi:deoxyguanosine kinase
MAAAGLPDYVVVEGPIGVGKTSLAKRLAETFGHAPLLERAEDNPFLERFYEDGTLAALPAQLHFLFQRSRQLHALRQRDLFSARLVADFLFEKDRLFAELNLDVHELALYEEVYARLAMETLAPDLVIYLQAPVDVLMQRVRKRGRVQEKGLTAGYLERVADSYTRFFYYFDTCPVLIVNAAGINLIDSDADYRTLLDELARPVQGKRYFNPAPLGLA